jgi:SNF2 family DNA or RNA helicase
MNRINNDKILDEKMKGFDVILDKAGFSMKQYQYDGIRWCLNNELFSNKVLRIAGGIIADEMGLGKTLTMIGLMFVNFKRRTLIVVPPVLINQWSNEIYKCSGHEALIYHGKHKQTITEEMLLTAPIVLTTYNMLLTLKKEKENILIKIKWNRVVFDEAHHLRNKKTTRFTSCKKIKADIKWLMSGTPVQNRRTDFYNLCNIIGLEDIKDNIPEIVEKYILRRTKADVGINLPPVFKEDLIVKWTNIEEKQMSEEIHSLLPNQTNVKQNMAGEISELLESRGLLQAMLKARQSCILPALLTKEFSELEYYDEALQSSSKLDALINLMISRKDNGNGKIIFCHFRNEIDTIAMRLRNGGYKNVAIYDGRNSNTKDGLKILSESADVIILQIQTGCEGLNLQQNFSEIYFVSPHWNPCVEDQAIGRCHRIGQTKPTYVFKFEMSGYQDDKDKDKDTDTDEDEDDEDEDDEDKDKDPVTLERYVNNVQKMKRDIINEIIKSA